MKIRNINSSFCSNDSYVPRLAKSHQKQPHHPSPQPQQIKLPHLFDKTIFKDQSNLLDSSSKSRIAFKQNLLNNNYFYEPRMSQSKSRSRLKIKQQVTLHVLEELKQKKRYHSECLWDEFKKEIELFQEECGEGEVNGRIERLEVAVEIVKEVRKLFNGEKMEVIDWRSLVNAEPDERQFAERQIHELYQFKMDQKEEELRQLKRICMELEEKVRLEKEGYKSALRKSIRNQIEDIHGPIGGSRVSDSRSSIFVGKDLFGVGMSLNQSIYNALNQIEDKKQVQMKEQTGQIKKQEEKINKVQFIQENKQVEEGQKGYLTGRFGGQSEQDIKIVVTRQQKFHKSRFITVNKLDQITISPINQQKQIDQVERNADNQKEVGQVFILASLDLQNTNVKQPQSQFNEQPPENQECHLDLRPKTLTCISGVISISVDPQPKKTFSIQHQFSLTLNQEYLGCRLKNHKVLTKMIIQLMTKAWNVVSKIQKRSSSSPLKKNLTDISERIYSYVKKFNESYINIKDKRGIITEQYYNSNTKQLKGIEEDIMSIVNQKLC